MVHSPTAAGDDASGKLAPSRRAAAEAGEGIGYTPPAAERVPPLAPRRSCAWEREERRAEQQLPTPPPPPPLPPPPPPITAAAAASSPSSSSSSPLRRPSPVASRPASVAASERTCSQWLCGVGTRSARPPPVEQRANLLPHRRQVGGDLPHLRRHPPRRSLARRRRHRAHSLAPPWLWRGHQPHTSRTRLRLSALPPGRASTLGRTLRTATRRALPTERLVAPTATQAAPVSCHQSPGTLL